MKIEYLHASKYGNGAAIAAEFKRQMNTKGVTVDVHHVREVKPSELMPADLYVFSSPGRFGKPIRSMRRFLRKTTLPAGTSYAILTTEAEPKPDSASKRQRVRPTMNEILAGKGLVKVAEDTIFVTGLKGPPEAGWERKVEAFIARVPIGAGSPAIPDLRTMAPAEGAKRARARPLPGVRA
jgi:hypothetical protein